MNAIDLLHQQHLEVESLFKQCVRATDATDKLRCVLQLADALTVHARIEEDFFYPACREAGLTVEVDEAVVEHADAKEMIAELLNLDPDDDAFDELLIELKDAVLYHVQVEEEPTLFPVVQERLDAERLDELGGLMEAEAGELSSEPEPRMHVFEELEAPL